MEFRLIAIGGFNAVFNVYYLGRDSVWRDSGQPVKLGPIDGRATIFIFFALYSLSMHAIVICFMGVIALVVLERFGYTIPNALRRLNVLVMGRHRVAVTSRRRGRVDR